RDADQFRRRDFADSAATGRPDGRRGKWRHAVLPAVSAQCEEVKDFVPRVKRRLDIEPLIPMIKPGMRGAVEFGTAHRAREDGPIAGKTGTCTESHTHLGWFGSFNDVGDRKLVVVVLLTGGRPSIGPVAAGIAG